MVTLKKHKPGLVRLGATYSLTLRDPCFGRDPYFGNNWLNQLSGFTAFRYNPFSTQPLSPHNLTRFVYPPVCRGHLLRIFALRNEVTRFQVQRCFLPFPVFKVGCKVCAHKFHLVCGYLRDACLLRTRATTLCVKWWQPQVRTSHRDCSARSQAMNASVANKASTIFHCHPHTFARAQRMCCHAHAEKEASK